MLPPVTTSDSNDPSSNARRFPVLTSPFHPHPSFYSQPSRRPAGFSTDAGFGHAGPSNNSHDYASRGTSGYAGSSNNPYGYTASSGSWSLRHPDRYENEYASRESTQGSHQVRLPPQHTGGLPNLGSLSGRRFSPIPEPPSGSRVRPLIRNLLNPEVDSAPSQNPTIPSADPTIPSADPTTPSADPPLSKTVSMDELKQMDYWSIWKLAKARGVNMKPKTKDALLRALSERYPAGVPILEGEDFEARGTSRTTRRPRRAERGTHTYNLRRRHNNPQQEEEQVETRPGALRSGRSYK